MLFQIDIYPGDASRGSNITTEPNTPVSTRPAPSPLVLRTTTLPSQTLYANVRTQEHNEDNLLLTLGRKVGHVQLENDKSVSREHCRLQLVAVFGARDRRGGSWDAAAADESTKALPCTNDMIVNDKDGTMDVQLRLENLGKFGTYVVEPYRPSAAAPRRAEKQDDTTTDDDEDDDGQDPGATSAAYNHGVIMSKIAHAWAPSPQSRLKKLEANESVLLPFADRGNNRAYGDDDAWRVIFQAGKMGSTIVVTKLRKLAVFSGLSPADSNQWTRERLSIQGLELMDHVSAATAMVITSQQSSSTKHLTAWLHHIPIVSVSYLQALWDRTVPSDPLPLIREHHAAGDGHDFWQQQDRPQQVWQSCVYFSWKKDDLQHLIAATGAAVEALYEFETQKEALAHARRVVAERPTCCFALHDDSKPKPSKSSQLATLGIPLLAPQAIATALTRHEMLKHPDTGELIGHKLPSPAPLSGKSQDDASQAAESTVEVRSKPAGACNKRSRQAGDDESVSADEGLPPRRRSRVIGVAESPNRRQRTGGDESYVVGAPRDSANASNKTDDQAQQHVDQLKELQKKMAELQRENEDLKEKNEDLNDKVEDLKEKNESLKEKNEDLKEKKEDLKEKYEHLKKKNEDLKEKYKDLNKKSIKYCVETIGLPRMSAHVKTYPAHSKRISDATTRREEDEGEGDGLDISQIPINFYEEGNEKLHFSTLFSVAEGGTVPHRNKNSVEYFVRLLGEDLLKLLRCRGYIKIIGQMSIFSLRPDLLVVKDEAGHIILVIEVKNLGPVDLTDDKKILGQLYDYLTGMREMGNPVPFGVLTDYNSMRIVHLDDNGDAYSEVKRQAFGDLIRMNGILPAVAEVAEEKMPSISPEKPRALVTLVDQIGPVQYNGTDGERAIEIEGPAARKIYVSQPYLQADAQRYIKAFLFSIACGYAAARKADASVTLIAQPNTTCDKRMLIVAKNSYTWGTYRGKFDYNQMPTARAAEFFLMGLLGYGSSGKTFIAATTLGRVCAIKFYMPSGKDDSKSLRDSQRNAFLATSKEDALKEAERWRELTQHSDVRVLMLNNFWCLLMPFFPPLGLESRNNRLNDVQRALTMFANQGYAYPETETEGVRWRHVGQRRVSPGDEPSIQLLDLLSLERIDPRDKGSIPKRIKNQIDSLRARSAQEDETEVSDPVV